MHANTRAHATNTQSQTSAKRHTERGERQRGERERESGEREREERDREERERVERGGGERERTIMLQHPLKHFKENHSI